MKHCNVCGRDLPLTAFHADNRASDGLRSCCRDCNIARAAEWRRAHGAPPIGEWLRIRRTVLASTAYRDVHRRVGEQRGRAASHSCAHCGGRAKDWAYDHADPNAIKGPTGRGLVVEYSADPAHYLPLCRSCHFDFDRQHAMNRAAAMEGPTTS